MSNHCDDLEAPMQLQRATYDLDLSLMAPVLHRNAMPSDVGRGWRWHTMRIKAVLSCQFGELASDVSEA